MRMQFTPGFVPPSALCKAVRKTEHVELRLRVLKQADPLLMPAQAVRSPCSAEPSLAIQSMTNPANHLGRCLGCDPGITLFAAGKVTEPPVVSMADGLCCMAHRCGQRLGLAG